MKYIIPDESVILNVLSATIDFGTCESIMMSHKVDKNGESVIWGELSMRLDLSLHECIHTIIDTIHNPKV